MSSAGSGIGSRIHEVARHSFGWETLRPGLGEAMEVLLDGGDVLAVMPTGYGKSSLYQVTGTILDGVTIVVSPLISLQEDQVHALAQATDVPRAVAINSSAGDAEREREWEALEAGDARFAFLAPEQLTNPDVRERLRSLDVSLFAVDEAHCVSSWGHDFRPDYLALGDVIEGLGHPPVVAMTATGAPPCGQRSPSACGSGGPGSSRPASTGRTSAWRSSGTRTIQRSGGPSSSK